MPKTLHTFSWQVRLTPLRRECGARQFCEINDWAAGYCDNNLWTVISTLRGVGYLNRHKLPKGNIMGMTLVPRSLDVNFERRMRKLTTILLSQETGRLRWCLDCTKHLPRGKCRILLKFFNEYQGGKTGTPAVKNYTTERGDRKGSQKDNESYGTRSLYLITASVL